MSDGGGAFLMCFGASAFPSLFAVVAIVILWSRREPRGSVLDLFVAMSSMFVAGTLTWEGTPWVLFYPWLGIPGALIGVAWMVTSVLLARGSPHAPSAAIGVGAVALVFHVIATIDLVLHASAFESDQLVIIGLYVGVAIPSAIALTIAGVRTRRSR